MQDSRGIKILSKQGTVPENSLQFSIFGVLFGLFILQYAVGVFSPELRDLRYLLPPLALAIVLFTRVNLGPERRAALSYLVRVSLLFGFLILVSLGVQFLQGRAYPRFLKEAYFLMGPLIFVLSMFCFAPRKNLDKYVRWMFFTLILTFLLLKKGNLLIFLADPMQLVIGLLTSKVSTETPTSLYFGLFFIYYTVTRNKTYSVGAFLLLILSFKRIAILGVLGTLLVIYILKLIRIQLPKHRTRVTLMAISFNIFIIAVIYMISTGAFDAYLEAKIGMTTNMLLKGRQSAYAVLFQEVGSIPLLGIGVGGTSAIMAQSGHQLTLAHSDLLKLFMEFGPILFIIFFAITYHIYGRSYQTLGFLLYMNILFITGNTLLYFSVMVCHYVLVSIIFMSLTAEKSEDMAPL